ncbi:1-acyl-sn-glycerol-3-phosphate acyltransferase [Cyanobium sp. NS01]|uniref:capsular polysaccharide export protein, LipB/KpsS family n=1 Tax=Cyanobium sp. NS01 TaxID=261284 RepID=UPI001CEC45B9|nr:1-acyl-sn-glycerol-3-phosphate acyltransferase [Cyanobium sp. NS01]
MGESARPAAGVALASVQIRIEGPVLLLMGPIGLFFSRLWRYLHDCGVPAYKISYPLHEFGFPRQARIPFSGSMEEWPAFLREVIQDKGIRHLFMYGDFIDPHRLAIEVAHSLNVDAYVFELGYVRPNYVTLERDRVNCRSNLNQPVSFYEALPAVAHLPQARLDPGWRWRKIWKAPTFFQHAFTRYRIIEGEHKLQPSPAFLWCQVRGSVRYWMYRLQERKLKHLLVENLSFFLAILQVSSDSQITTGSGFRGMHDFIETVIVSFAAHAHPSDHLAFKHHPRDRGYNNYKSLIHLLAEREGVAGRVHYFHDGPLSAFIRTCRGVVTVNSTVGLQSLFHAAATKVMGQTFYNLPGLTDQQPLDGFWAAPQTSSRPLFYRFYNHLVTTTQINGNFDGEFPFRETLPVALSARSSPAQLGRAQATSLGWVVPLRVIYRLFCFGAMYVAYALELIALTLRLRRLARHLLTAVARFGLRAVGIDVIVDDSLLLQDDQCRRIHIWNHNSPFDVFAIQGYLQIPAVTTSGLHLNRLLPFFDRSATNAGHVLLDHRQPDQRRSTLWKSSQVLERHGQLMIAPNGSLKTSILQRASASAYLLARRHRATVVPWWFEYRGLEGIEAGALYRPLRLLAQRLTAPRVVLHCRQGRPEDLGLPVEENHREGFSRRVMAYYSQDAAGWAERHHHRAS